MRYSVYSTPGFLDDLKQLARKYPSLKKDVSFLITSLEENPKQGIALGKDCYKIRLAIKSKQKGKSGGGRVITCVRIKNISVYLITIFDKSVKSTITEQELDSLLKGAGLL